MTNFKTLYDSNTERLQCGGGGLVSDAQASNTRHSHGRVGYMSAVRAAQATHESVSRKRHSRFGQALGDAVLMSAAVTAAGVMRLLAVRLMMSAATPATWGAAIDVPCRHGAVSAADTGRTV